MWDILTELAKIGPVVALLVVAVWYFIKKEKGYKTEILNLQLELRESEKENLTALYKVTAFFDKMLENDKVKNELLLKELHIMREAIELKIEGLRKDG